MIKICLAILKLTGSRVTKKNLRRGFKYNSDGAGFMYVKHNSLLIEKGFFIFRKFYKALRQAEAQSPESNFVIHFRISTSGQTDFNNCHPFYVKSNIAFAHNGIFAKLGNKHFSDTIEFNLKYLQRTSSDFMKNPKQIKWIKSKCGFLNKLVFLNSKNEYLIINEDEGIWENGIWYSNETFREAKKYSYKTIYDYWDTKYNYDYTSACVNETKTEEEVVLRMCEICQGYYPMNELTFIHENNNYVCDSCMDFAASENIPIVEGFRK